MDDDKILEMIQGLIDAGMATTKTVTVLNKDVERNSQLIDTNDIKVDNIKAEVEKLKLDMDNIKWLLKEVKEKLDANN